MPEPKDEVVIGHAKLVVLGMRRRRIMRVLVTLDRPILDNPDLKILLKQSEGPREHAMPSDIPAGGNGGAT